MHGCTSSLYINLGNGACVLAANPFNSSFVSCGYSDYAYFATGLTKQLKAYSELKQAVVLNSIRI
jgi:hypothetical protein